MIKRLVILAAGLAVGVGGIVVASSDRAPVSELEYVIAEAGDNYFAIVRDNALSCNGVELRNANGRNPLDPGTIVLIPPYCTQPAPTTTSTLPPDTTEATTTTTVAPTTTEATTTTTEAPATTVPPATVPPVVAGFVETFTANAGLDRFRRDVWNRDGAATGTVSADHDMTCGDPSTQRTVSGANPASSFYVCRDHLMTAVGDWSGYSVAWFTPDQTFSTERSVSWDVNVTDLKARQWWEVTIVPAGFNSGVPSCPQCSATTWLPTGLPNYPAQSVVIGNGPFGGSFKVLSDRDDIGPLAWRGICGQFAVDSTACASKTIRRTFSITDNDDGTLTLSAFNRVWTFAGSFPDEFNVVFKDHNYTPDKDGRPVGYTWHWDNIAIT